MSSEENGRWRASGRRLGWIAAFVLALPPCVMPAPAFAEASPAAAPTRIFRIGTGGAKGTYFPIGKLIASGLSDAGPDCGGGPDCGVHGVLAVAQLSNGSVSNVEALGAGALEAGLVQSDVASWAFHGVRGFGNTRGHDRLRAVAALYSESVHLVARAGGLFRGVRDLRGKRVSLDEPGSGTLVDARVILGAYGLKETDLLPIYVKPQFAAERIARDGLDAFFIVAGDPVQSVSDLASHHGAGLVPIDGAEARAIVEKYPYFSTVRIEAGTYPGIPATPTLAVGAQLLVSADLDADLVYRLTRSLWSERTLALLAAGHPKGREIRPARALAGIGIPLHPGAARYYREVGIGSAPGGASP